MSPEMQEITRILENGALSAMTIEQIINQEISEWKTSKKRKQMIEGDQYYRNKTDILDRERTVIGEDGREMIVTNLANNKLVNGFVRKLVDQKVGYLLSKPISIQCEDEEYQKTLADYFDKSMLRRLQSLGKESINKGISWLHPYYDEDGIFSFKKMESEEIIPLWKDEAHTLLDAIIRTYDVESYEGTKRKTITKIEWWDTDGVKRYVLQGGLIPDVEAGHVGSHFTAVEGEGEEKKEIALNWERVPFIPFKYNEEEQPLVELIKSLVDDYDSRKSDNTNNLEDLPNSIYVVKDHDGTNTGEFRKNIATYRTVFVSGEGGVDTISLEIDTEAYKTHMEINRKDIYEFGRGVDTQSKEFGNSPSGIALRFLYADLDMDANIIENDFQAALEQLCWFIDVHIQNTTGVDYSEKDVEFIFNRDIMINETEAVENISNSRGILSDETLVAQHPFVTDVDAEMKRLKKQQKVDMLQYPSLGIDPKKDED